MQTFRACKAPEGVLCIDAKLAEIQLSQRLPYAAFAMADRIRVSTLEYARIQASTEAKLPAIKPATLEIRHNPYGHYSGRTLHTQPCAMQPCGCLRLIW